jgi:transketolase
MPATRKSMRDIEPDHGLDELCINTIRTLAMDAVQRANSGHPGTPMALAPVAYTLWQKFLRMDPDDPTWPNRDRFVLSNGHASMLLYALLHLAGVRAVDSRHDKSSGELAVTLEDIKRFRQIGSNCPGHPEYGLTSGVEATTGPLGQGCGNSVGMALAARWLAQRFNRPDFRIFDYVVYAMCGDGDMMEGVSGEAASFAGHQMLGNLCWIYDSNRITIEGHTDLAFSEDVAARFLAYGWNVEHVGDANDTERFAAAVERCRHTGDAPMLIIVDSHIGFGAPHKHDTSPATASRWAKKRCASPSAATDGPRMRNFSFRTAFVTISSKAWLGVVAVFTNSGSNSSTPTGRNFPISPMRFCACRCASFPRIGTRTCRRSARTLRGSQPAIPPERCSMLLRNAILG